MGTGQMVAMMMPRKEGLTCSAEEIAAAFATLLGWLAEE